MLRITTLDIKRKEEKPSTSTTHILRSTGTIGQNLVNRAAASIRRMLSDPTIDPAIHTRTVILNMQTTESGLNLLSSQTIVPLNDRPADLEANPHLYTAAPIARR